MPVKPVNDPASTKYPDRTFYAGAWRTPEQIESVRELRKKHGRSPRSSKWRARYKDSEKGRDADARYESSAHRRLHKQLYEMTRIRVRY